MENFKCKAQFMAGGNMTEALTTVTYVSIVSSEKDRVELMVAAFNDIEMKPADILNGYVQAPVTEER